MPVHCPTPPNERRSQPQPPIEARQLVGRHEQHRRMLLREEEFSIRQDARYDAKTHAARIAVAAAARKEAASLAATEEPLAREATTAREHAVRAKLVEAELAAAVLLRPELAVAPGPARRRFTLRVGDIAQEEASDRASLESDEAGRSIRLHGASLRLATAALTERERVGPARAGVASAEGLGRAAVEEEEWWERRPAAARAVESEEAAVRWSTVCDEQRDARRLLTCFCDACRAATAVLQRARASVLAAAFTGGFAVPLWQTQKREAAERFGIEQCEDECREALRLVRDGGGEDGAGVDVCAELAAAEQHFANMVRDAISGSTTPDPEPPPQPSVCFDRQITMTSCSASAVCHCIVAVEDFAAAGASVHESLQQHWQPFVAITHEWKLAANMRCHAAMQFLKSERQAIDQVAAKIADINKASERLEVAPGAQEIADFLSETLAFGAATNTPGAVVHALSLYGVAIDWASAAAQEAASAARAARRAAQQWAAATHIHRHCSQVVAKMQASVDSIGSLSALSRVLQRVDVAVDAAFDGPQGAADLRVHNLRMLAWVQMTLEALSPDPDASFGGVDPVHDVVCRGAARSRLWSTLQESTSGFADCGMSSVKLLRRATTKDSALRLLMASARSLGRQPPAWGREPTCALLIEEPSPQRDRNVAADWEECLSTAVAARESTGRSVQPAQLVYDVGDLRVDASLRFVARRARRENEKVEVSEVATRRRQEMAEFVRCVAAEVQRVECEAEAVAIVSERAAQQHFEAELRALCAAGGGEDLTEFRDWAVAAFTRLLHITTHALARDRTVRGWLVVTAARAAAGGYAADFDSLRSEAASLEAARRHGGDTEALRRELWPRGRRARVQRQLQALWADYAAGAKDIAEGAVATLRAAAGPNAAAAAEHLWRRIRSAESSATAAAVRDISRGVVAVCDELYAERINERIESAAE
eukprot:TRINITY_DN10886_c0_g1_i1.p1 TRINITY_DN10886_c0_g1~~TRINITY_DN10886_c0_g1_i1.p1  ORF type:complete len:944 (+),score=253.57 TRINITY_DN10886_c0_g1_i1:53-2884(+)